MDHKVFLLSTEFSLYSLIHRNPGLSEQFEFLGINFRNEAQLNDRRELILQLNNAIRDNRFVLIVDNNPEMKARELLAQGFHRPLIKSPEIEKNQKAYVKSHKHMVLVDKDQALIPQDAVPLSQPDCGQAGFALFYPETCIVYLPNDRQTVLRLLANQLYPRLIKDIYPGSLVEDIPIKAEKQDILREYVDRTRNYSKDFLSLMGGTAENPVLRLISRCATEEESRRNCNSFFEDMNCECGTVTPISGIGRKGLSALEKYREKKGIVYPDYPENQLEPVPEEPTEEPVLVPAAEEKPKTLAAGIPILTDIPLEKESSPAEPLQSQKPEPEMLFTEDTDSLYASMLAEDSKKMEDEKAQVPILDETKPTSNEKKDSIGDSKPLQQEPKDNKENTSPKEEPANGAVSASGSEASAQKKKQQGRSPVIRVLLIICILVFLGSAVYLGQYYWKSAQNKSSYENLREVYEKNTVIPPAGYPAGYDNDLAALWELNHDTVGWISIDGTDLDYPVVQTEDNEKYYRTNFAGEYSEHAVPFVDSSVDLKAPSTNILIYGHNIRADGQMFNILKDYGKVDFYQAHPTVKFHSVYHENEYKIFSVFYANTHPDHGKVFPYHEFINAENEQATQDYIDDVTIRSIIETGVDVKPSDEILTLSTCSYEFKDARFVVAARKLRPGEKASDGVEQARKNPTPLYPDVWYQLFGGSKPNEQELKQKLAH